MIGRIFIALVLALTSLMIAIAPIATPAFADHVACDPQPASVTSDSMYDHEGHHASLAEPASDRENGLALAPCCAHGYVFDLSLAADTVVDQAIVSGFLAGWTVIDLADLTAPNGLRRPPKS